MRSFRLKALAIHMLCSAVVLTLVVGGLYIGWYYSPLWHLMGASTVVGVLIMVDMGLGPLATVVVASPKKPRSELRRDIALIVVLQLAALGYGVHALWAMRPLFLVFSGDRAEVISATAIDAPEVEAAVASGQVSLLPAMARLPTWVWAPLPEDEEARTNIVAGAIMGGKDVTAMPMYYQPLTAAGDALRNQLIPMDRVRGLKSLLPGEFERRLSAIGRNVEDLGVLPIEARAHDGAVIFDRKTLEPLAIWPVSVLSLIRH